MAQDYTEYLAVHVLNEQQYVSYRALSRALKVHSNLAKQMLYDFHHKQNSRKPGCVHATYLITGMRRSSRTSNSVQSQEDGEDSVMQSSPLLPSSSMPDPNGETVEEPPVKTIMLVKEEYLDQARQQWEEITGMHIYSLQASTPKDIHVLTDCNRRLASEYTSEDPLKAWKQYGTIQNADVKRRSGNRPPPPPPPPAAPVPKPVSVKAEAAASAAAKSSAAEVNSAIKPPEKKTTTTDQSNSVATKPAATKKQEPSIFKAFAKGAVPPKKIKSEQGSTAASPAPAQAVPEDVPMTGFSDDEMDNDDPDSDLLNEHTKVPAGKSRKDRQAELQAMMDQEDESMDDAESPAAEERHDDGAVDQAESQEEPETKETVTVEGGRRRGRRRVMKKKTVKDEEGYLVTREEAAWESFSEDEPAPKKPKVQAAINNKPVPGKKGAKPGQGNIMSFFGKK